jgi:hypothetical protein
MVSLLCTLARTQSSSAPGHTSQSVGNIGNRANIEGQDNTARAVQSLEGHMDMGPHIRMTPLRKPTPGDAERANRTVADARRVAEKYTDYHTALADGYQIFLPDLPQKMYHFVNYRNALVVGQFEFCFRANFRDIRAKCQAKRPTGTSSRA